MEVISKQKALKVTYSPKVYTGNTFGYASSNFNVLSEDEKKFLSLLKENPDSDELIKLLDMKKVDIYRYLRLDDDLNPVDSYETSEPLIYKCLDRKSVKIFDWIAQKGKYAYETNPNGVRNYINDKKNRDIPNHIANLYKDNPTEKAYKEMLEIIVKNKSSFTFNMFNYSYSSGNNIMFTLSSIKDIPYEIFKMFFDVMEKSVFSSDLYSEDVNRNSILKYLISNNRNDLLKIVAPRATFLPKTLYDVMNEEQKEIFASSTVRDNIGTSYGSYSY